MTGLTIAHLAVLGVVLAAVALAIAGWYVSRQLRAYHLLRLAEEKANGHFKVRRRMRSMVGKTKDTYDGVMRADTMYGWVWMAFTRRPREPYVEIMEWAPTRRAARRALARYRDGR